MFTNSTAFGTCMYNKYLGNGTDDLTKKLYAASKLLPTPDLKYDYEEKMDDTPRRK